MRILQIVQLITPDGTYGGAARVAVNQSAELTAQGHDVTLAAGTRGYRVVPSRLNGVQARLFPVRTLVPATGFAGLGAPALSSWFSRNRADFDMVHIHFSRELVVLQVALAARRHRVPYVLQTHGMVVPSSHPLAAPVDGMWVRKLLRDAGTVFYLTPLEREQLMAVAGPDIRVAQLLNGVPEYPAAVEDPGPPEVLYAARLQSRKRPLAFVEMAKALLDAGVDARFALVGPDEGEGAAVRVAVDGDPRICWEGSLPPEAIPERMAAASVYVLPSVREPYPMSVLEAMSVGVPVVVSSDCGLAPVVERTRSGLVTDPEAPALAAAVGSLLADRSLARAMGARGRETTQTEFGMRDIGDRLLTAYADLVGVNR